MEVTEDRLRTEGEMMSKALKLLALVALFLVAYWATVWAFGAGSF